MAGLREHAVGLAEVLRSADSPHFWEVVNDWGGSVLVDLSTPCRSWLASQFVHLDREERAAVVRGLGQVEQGGELGEGVGERYRQFAQSLGQGAWDTDELRDHLLRMTRKAVEVTPVQPTNAGPQPALNSARSYLSEVMPVLASSLELLPAGDAAALLDRVFSQALYIGNAPALLGEIHASMVGKWPSLEQVEYEAADIFETGESALEGQPQMEHAPELLRSVASLAERAPLEPDYTQRVLDTACMLWTHHAGQAAEVIISYNRTPEPGHLAGLAQSIEPDATAETSRLNQVWTHCATRMDVAEQVEVTVALLEASPVQVEGHPDWALETWLEALPKPAAALSTTLTDGRLADEDLERLWRRAGEMATRLGQEFFRDVLPRLLARQDIEKTVYAVRASSQQIIDLHESQRAKNELGRGLLEALVASPSESVKGMLAEWIGEASAGGSFGHLKSLNPSETDLEILLEKFPNNSHLQSYKKRKD